MRDFRQAAGCTPLVSAAGARTILSLALGAACFGLTGCAALTNPVEVGLPARQLPPELRGETRAGLETIPLRFLRQEPPEVYRLAAGDVLAVFVEGILGDKDKAPPVHASPGTDVPPALGFPLPIREDGTLPLPLVEPLRVEGMSIAEAEKAVNKAYMVNKKILQPGARIIVTLLHPRQYHILVIRQDTPNTVNNISIGVLGPAGGTEVVEQSNRRGTGTVVDLAAYENDVLHALAKTGGLPGSDAQNEIIIDRGFLRGVHHDHDVREELACVPPDYKPGAATTSHGGVTRIPLRLRPGEKPPFRPEDILLHSGNIVFIESRRTDVYYTAGLLPPGEHILPRDSDLDVIDAVIRVHGPLVSGGIGASNLSGAIVAGGVGNPSPSLLTVLRKTPEGGRIPIRVSLNQALQDPRDRILVQPGDELILQETPQEAIARFFTSQFGFSSLFTPFRYRDGTGSANIVGGP
jgi:hypothetical protein